MNMFNMKCPRCRRDDRIDIAATIWVRLTENGTDADEAHNGVHEYGPNSPATCWACGYFGHVTEFEPKEAQP